ncbi:MAG: hypothetical protein J7L96_08700 [Bacteroidales bacterium]|nr:hypothetical protein [Bacteroidales bacterium]
MRIEDLRLIQENDKTKIVATVYWEDSDRQSQELYFAADDILGQNLSLNPHAFLVACIIPAMYFGEKRVLIDAEICPELIDGLITVMTFMRHWFDRYRPTQKLVRIESKTFNKLETNIKPSRSGLLYSGGIDSLATLRSNRLNYPAEHPGSFKDGLLVYGLEVQDLDKFKHVLSSLADLAKDVNLVLIPVYTNIITLGPSNLKELWGDFWTNEFMGAAFAAIAHAFSNRLSSLSINSCHSIPDLIPHSSHPLIDPNYSSSDLRIRHEGIHLSRYEKTKLIADWDLGLQHLRVCNRTDFNQHDMLNCGCCEKCVRTMLALLASGALKKVYAFPSHDVSEKLIDTAVKLAPNIVSFYKELIEPLEAIGRYDLSHAIQKKIADYYKSLKKEQWRNSTIVPVKEFDRKYFKGNLRKIKKLVLP